MLRISVMGLMALSLATVGCQQTKMGSNPPKPVQQSATPPPGTIRPVPPPVQQNPPPTQVVNTQPPPNVTPLPIPAPPGTRPPSGGTPTPVNNNPPVVPPNNGGGPVTVTPPAPPAPPPTVTTQPTQPTQPNYPPPTQPTTPVVVNQPTQPTQPVTPPPVQQPSTPVVTTQPTQPTQPVAPPPVQQPSTPITVTQQQPPQQQIPPVVETVNTPPSTQTQPAPCAGPQINCPSQQVALTPPPAAEDRTLVDGGSPLVQRQSTQPASPLQPVPLEKMIVDSEPAPAVTSQDFLKDVTKQPAKPLPSPEVSTQVASYPPLDQSCAPVPLDSALDTKKVDLLLLLDVSDSMRGGKKTGREGELGGLARSLPTLMQQLDEGADIRIAMMLGFGSVNSPNHGALLKIDKNDQPVVDVTALEKTCAGDQKAKRQCAMGKVTQALMAKINAIQDNKNGQFEDKSEAQGEALQLSLYNAIMMESKREAIQKAHFFRKNALLSVVAISDEQDVCFDYTTCDNEGDPKKCVPALVHKDAKGNAIGTGQDLHEVNYFKSTCQSAINKDNSKGMVGTRAFSYNDLYDALISLKGGAEKVAYTPVIYLDNNIPIGMEDENEMGHGNYELAKRFGGTFANLASVDRKEKQLDFAPILQQIGKFNDFKMRYSTNSFQCSSDVHPSSVNQTTARVEIVDKSGKTVAVFSGDCPFDKNDKSVNSCPKGVDGGVRSEAGMNGDGTHPYSIFTVSPSTMSDKLNQAGFKEGEVRISFKTRSDVNPQSGIGVGSRSVGHGLQGPI